ncbi:AraC family transcriptional regulator [Glycomyces tenuis]|uniref:AraC family transcriptional regulator n=1 Tax=Glycomyces tenuis TaxID=58116 RepID=UPI00138AD820|nr:AraC family transcriptional regulator [Glycomyces tenuis]
MIDTPLMPVPSLPWRFSTRTVDLDLANAQGIETYYPLRMRVLSGAERFLMSIDAMQLGAVLLGDCRFDADVRMDIAELQKFYHVNIPLSGYLDSTNLRNGVTATLRRAVLYGPTGDVQLNRWGAGSRILCIKIRRSALEAELERLLQRTVRTPINLAPSVDLTRGYGLMLRNLALLLADQVRHEEPLARQEIIGGPLWHSVLAYVLAAADHDYRDELLNPGPSYGAPVVNRVIEAMHAAPQTAFTSAELADIAGVSIRTLQAAFRSYVGLSPMAFLRNLRLERAHAELVAADPSRTTVAEVAHRWGFAHLGRFAQAYGRKFGVRPSETLLSAGFANNRALFG